MRRNCYLSFTLFLLCCTSSRFEPQDAGPLAADAMVPRDSSASDTSSTPDAYRDIAADVASDAASDATLPLDAPDAPTDVPASCEYSIGAGLSELCFPACTVATTMTLRECDGDSDCTGRAIDTDGSPPFDFARDDEDWTPWLSWFAPNRCRQCERLGALMCWNQFCPGETAELLSCYQRNDAERCAESSNTLRTCARASDQFSRCYQYLTDKCLAPS
jgi:hypothetical protein